MEEVIFKFLGDLQVSQLIAMAAMFWFFSKHQDKKFKKIDEKFDKIDVKFDKIDIRFEKIEAKFDKVNDRIDRLSEKVDGIDKRLCRIEGSLATQGHCLFSQKSEKKAE